MSISKEKIHNINIKISGSVTREIQIWAYKIYPANFKSYKSLIFAPKKGQSQIFQFCISSTPNLVLSLKLQK